MTIKLFQIKKKKNSKYFCEGEPLVLKFFIWYILNYRHFNYFINNIISINVSTLKELVSLHLFINIKLIYKITQKTVEFDYNKIFHFLTKYILFSKKENNFIQEKNNVVDITPTIVNKNIYKLKEESNKIESYTSINELIETNELQGRIVKDIEYILS
jgi:hypothetical protein